MSLKSDWDHYLTDATSFDAEHFERLLFEDNLFNHPDQIFRTLPGGATIVSRLNRMVAEWNLQGAYFVASGSAPADVQLMRARKFADELANLGDDEGLEDDAAALRAAPINFTMDRLAFEEMHKDRNLVVSEIPDLLFDIEQDLMNKRDSRLFGVYEALLGLTTRPEVVSWIMADSLSTPIDLEPAYELYRDGGKLLLVHEALQLLLPEQHH